MRVTNQIVKKAFDEAEANLNFCWKVLVDIKDYNNTSKELGENLLEFQQRLAESIFNLQRIRDKIIAEEKETISLRKRYKNEWFLSKVRRLASFKEGIDNIVNTIKALGDAYVYFFYQNDLDLVKKHYTHQKVINHTASIGERGELEFVKNIKHIEGKLTLYHGITNCLRYGDFSFIDLKKLRIEWIGELKTSQINENNLELKLTILERNSFVDADKVVSDQDISSEKDRRKRQLLGIAKFLSEEKPISDEEMDLMNLTYAHDINTQYLKTKINDVSNTKISSGLLVSCTRVPSSSFYKRFIAKGKRTPNPIRKNEDEIREQVTTILKKDSISNSIIVSALLYDKNLSDKNIPGQVPLFWGQLDEKLLKEIYFSSCFIIIIFNPAFVFDQLYTLGYKIKSEYSSINTVGPFLREIDNIDIFISNILNHLFTENYVIEVMTNLMTSKLWHEGKQIRLNHNYNIFSQMGVSEN